MIDDHVVPPSCDTVAPPSLPLMSRLGSFGSTHMVCVSPWGTRMRENVFPASIDFHTVRFITYSVFSFVGSAVTFE